MLSDHRCTIKCNEYAWEECSLLLDGQFNTSFYKHLALYGRNILTKAFLYLYFYENQLSFAHQNTKMMLLALNLTKRFLLICSFFLIHHVASFAQLPTGELILGIKGGANGEMHLPGINKGSNISGLPRTIISPIFEDSTYSTTEISQVGFTGGLFGNWRFDGADMLAFQLDVLFSQQTGGYEYYDNEGLSYKMEFKYRYLYFMPSVKLIIMPNNSGSPFARAGLYFGVNLTPENIFYCHDGQEDIYGPCEYVELELQTILEGKGDSGFFISLGYEQVFNKRWSIILEISGHRGWTDVLTPKPSANRFTDNDNFIRWVQGSLGVAFSFGK